MEDRFQGDEIKKEISALKKWMIALVAVVAVLVLAVTVYIVGTLREGSDAIPINEFTASANSCWVSPRFFRRQINFSRHSMGFSFIFHHDIKNRVQSKPPALYIYATAGCIDKKGRKASLSRPFPQLFPKPEPVDQAQGRPHPTTPPS